MEITGGSDGPLVEGKGWLWEVGGGGAVEGDGNRERLDFGGIWRPGEVQPARGEGRDGSEPR